MESQQCLYPSIGIVWHSLIGVHTLAHIQKHARSRFVCPPPPDLTACTYTPSFPCLLSCQPSPDLWLSVFIRGTLILQMTATDTWKKGANIKSYTASLASSFDPINHGVCAVKQYSEIVCGANNPGLSCTSLGQLLTCLKPVIKNKASHYHKLLQAWGSFDFTLRVLFVFFLCQFWV